jgi:hypothetical protein
MSVRRIRCIGRFTVAIGDGRGVTLVYVVYELRLQMPFGMDRELAVPGMTIG